jgi:hypothetical protein
MTADDVAELDHCRRVHSSWQGHRGFDCPRLLPVALLLALAVGCDRSEQVIRRYRVTKPAAMPGVQQQRPVMPNPHMPAGSGLRMLGAIVPHGQTMWFFKLTGPTGLLERQKERFEQFVRSITFPPAGDEGSEDEPIGWKLPDGWRQMPGSGIRYATIIVGEEPHQLELSVTPLARSANTVLANVNRWRQMMGLPPVEQAELPKVVKTISVAGETATLVDIESKPSESARPEASGATRSR